MIRRLGIRWFRYAFGGMGEVTQLESLIWHKQTLVTGLWRPR